MMRARYGTAGLMKTLEAGYYLPLSVAVWLMKSFREDDRRLRVRETPADGTAEITVFAGARDDEQIDKFKRNGFAFDGDASSYHVDAYSMVVRRRARRPGTEVAVPTRRNPDTASIELIDEVWRPPGVYRVGRDKRKIYYTLLSWVTADGMWNLGLEGGGREWWFNYGDAVREDQDDFGQWSSSNYRFEVNAASPTEFDLRAMGFRGYLVLERMLERFRRLQREQPKHKPSRMPRRKTVRGVSY